MLKRISHLTKFTLAATDGDIGTCRDFLFDDRDWVVRYLVAQTGGWLTGRKVLVSPASLGEPSWTSERFPLRLTRQQVEQCPALDEHAPVSREYEIAYYEYLNMPYYWLGDDLWGAYPDPRGMIHPVPESPPEIVAEADQPEEGHLRSCDEVVGYNVYSVDDIAEAVEDVLVDDRTWALRYLVVDTRRWLPGGRVLIPTSRLHAIDWVDRRIDTDLSSEIIKGSPRFDPERLLDPNFEKGVSAYFEVQP
jgi:hypothetical protein